MVFAIALCFAAVKQSKVSHVILMEPRNVCIITTLISIEFVSVMGKIYTKKERSSQLIRILKKCMSINVVVKLYSENQNG